MFGHNNDDNQQQNQNQEEPTTIQPAADATVPPAMQGFTPPPVTPATPAPAADDTAADAPVPNTALDVSADSALELPESPTLPGNLTAGAPVTDDSAAPEPATTAPTPMGSDDTSTTADDTADNSDVTLPSDIPSDLLNIKQEALQELSPLVEHLEQSPEERFRTTMMMIQATDDSSKIKDAYDAAQKIEDNKVRAQALLDVVNEINYFTQQQKQAE